MNAVWPTRSAAAGRAAAIALGFSIPISVAADNVLLALIVVTWLLSLRYAATVAVVTRIPIAAAACVWAAVHLLGTVYSVGEHADVIRSAGKAANFLLVPVLIVLLSDSRSADRALYAFLAAITLTLLLSCMRWAHLIPAVVPLLKSTSNSSSVVFKYHLTQNLLLALGSFIFAVQATRATTRRAALTWAALAALAAINVTVMGDGRTGQVVLLVLVVYFVAWRAGLKGAIAGAVAAATLAAGAYAVPHSSLRARADLALSEAREWRLTVAPKADSSIGERLGFYVNSAAIVMKHPLVGAGTGGFPVTYAREVAGTPTPPTRNPHNEYLLKGVEFGIPGVILLVALYATIWITAGRIGDPAYVAIARALALTFATASVSASTLSDHTEGLLFIWLAGVAFSRYSSTRAPSEGVH